MTPKAGNCVGCDIPMFSLYSWATIPPAERERMIREGFASKHLGRGLCSRCYNSAYKSDRLIDHERRSMPRADVVEEFELLGSGRSKYDRIRELAPRLGMTAKAVERSLLDSGISA